MEVSEAIFVGRGDAIKLEVDGTTVIDLNGALAAAASDATQITILGGYYDRLWLLDLLRELPRARRRDCKVRIAVGSDATITLPKVWEHMREVQRELRRIGYRSLEIAIVGRSPVHFHTKLFRFLRTTHPYWFVGSANPGSDRHELMLRLSGCHEELSNYVDAVFEAAQSVNDEPPRRKRPSTLRDFFLDGVLCHKPPYQQLFTFDAYRLSPEDRGRIDTRIGEGSAVEYASPRTEGFGFGLRRAIGMADTDPGEKKDTASRVRFRDYGMDTLFGLWMPSAYAAIVQASVTGREAAIGEMLRAIGQRLADAAGQQAAHNAFARYIASMDRYLNDLDIEAKPVRDRDAAFARFLKSRTDGLSKDSFVSRHARVMTIAPMFDVWQDADVAAQFVQSFFDDLAWRATPTTTHKSKIVRSLIESLGDDADWETPENLQAAFVDRLEIEPWDNDEWQ
ncbi:MAG: hypothetical protein K2P80_14525 [Beijerinckiaceae bacterium]|nr:hypothetical protein [Beijerinckiaceae bacterium]